jgi:hypothetical protein
MAGIFFAHPLSTRSQTIPSNINRIDVGVRTMKVPSNLGMLLLGIWLIATGALGLLGGTITLSIGTLLAILAIVAGILIIMGR